MAFFDSSWVSASVNASYNTFAALGATNSLIGNPLAQSGYANIMNGINNAIRFGQASASLPQSQRAGTIGTLDVGDQVNASRTSFIDFYDLGTNTSLALKQVAIGIATNSFNPVLTIIDFSTGKQLTTFDNLGTGTVLANFIAQPGHTYGVAVQSLRPARGTYAIQEVVW